MFYTITAYNAYYLVKYYTSGSGNYYLRCQMGTHLVRRVAAPLHDSMVHALCDAVDGPRQGQQETRHVCAFNASIKASRHITQLMQIQFVFLNVLSTKKKTKNIKE